VSRGGQFCCRSTHVTGLSRPTVYFWLKRYVQQRRIEALRDGTRRGRPPAADCITSEQILLELSSPPSNWGYSTHIWTVVLLAGHLEWRYGCPINPHPLRRRMKAMGLRWKRPRYVFSEKAPHLPQKKERLSVG